jgi:hypothetical protein
VFTRALHWSLSWARSIQSIPSQPISPRTILILSTYLRLGLPSGLFPSGFPTNILYAFLFYPIRATWYIYIYIYKHTTKTFNTWWWPFWPKRVVYLFLIFNFNLKF